MEGGTYLSFDLKRLDSLVGPQNWSYPVILGMSLSNICQGRCVWCPIGKQVYKRRNDQFISMQTVENIISNFRRFQLNEIWFSENGESLLHPRFKEIISRFREEMNSPFCSVSNMQLMDSSTSKWMLEKGFVWFSVNVDGCTPESYRATKGLDLETTLKNIKALVANREKINPLAYIMCNIFPAGRYFLEIGEKEKAIEYGDDTWETYKMVREILWGYPNTTFFNPFPLMWAIREERKVPRKLSYCTGMPSLMRKAFIDTDGNLYPCCLDYSSDYVFGNINGESLNSIWFGEKRRRFLDLLFKGKYGEIGRPCLYCQD